MPPELVKAHHALDRAVDAAYVSTESGRSGKTAFKTEVERVVFLFERYQHLTVPLVQAAKPLKRKRSNVKI